MIYSFWENQNYPILVDPDFADLQHIMSEKWDNLRICISHDGLHIGIASGEGNTHGSINKAMRKLLGLRCIDTWDYILFREDGDYWFNMQLYAGGARKVQYLTVLSDGDFTEDQANMIRDLVNNR